MTKLLSFFIYLLFLEAAQSRVEPPNYDFSLDKFQIFMPGKSLDQIEKQYKSKSLIFKEGDFQTYKFHVEHIRYKFPIFVQFKGKTVTDFHARLPQYFLHDIFHQSLINKLGAQDVYKKVEEQAIYIWKNNKNLRHYYSGACTITCFPIFYAVRSVDHKNGSEYLPLIQKFTQTKKTKD